MKSITIIGSGIIGLSTAYYLNKEGHSVTVIDQTDLKDGCSFGNAGMIVPSHIIPLASPGMIAKGIQWMFNSTSPFYVKPGFNGSLIKWGYQFYKHSNKEHLARAIPAIHEISQLSKFLYERWSKELPFDFGYREKGLLMLYHKPDTEQEEIETARIANKTGVEAHVLSLTELQKLEPEVRVQAKGGIYYPGDANVTPRLLIENLIQYLKDKGVVFRTQCVVTGFEMHHDEVKSVKTLQGEYDVEELIVATGSWSGTLCAALGISLPMQAGKGYSFTLDDVVRNTRIPSIFLEDRVAVTPMGNSLRFGGTMEISGVNDTVNMNRVKGIVDSIPHYYPEMKVAMPKIESVWHGLRPCSPDGLPYIGRSAKKKNVIIATGHSMMGLSLGPATGKLVSELVMGEKPSITIKAFDPERYDR